MNDAEFNKLKQAYDSARSAADEARGALSGLQNRLRDDFGLESVKDAKVRLKSLSDKKEKLERQFEKELKEYQKAFPEA